LETITKKLYEAMFLVDSAEAAADWGAVERNIKNILEKAGAEIVSMKKWEEQRLAYEINGHSRGTYILCYFRGDGKRIGEIERDSQLSEQIMRVLILCAEGREEEDIEKEAPAAPAEESEVKAAEKAEAVGTEQPEQGKAEPEQIAEQEEKKSEGTEASE